jgi:uncharacterized protein with PIN domain
MESKQSLTSIINPSFKVCPTCNKDIDADKFRLHEVSCARNNFLCPKCKEVVLKADREHHE